MSIAGDSFQLPDFLSMCPFQSSSAASSSLRKQTPCSPTLDQTWNTAQNSSIYPQEICRSAKIDLLTSRCFASAEQPTLSTVNRILKLVIYLKDLARQSGPEDFLVCGEEIIRMMVDSAHTDTVNNDLCRTWKRIQRTSSPSFQDSLIGSIERLVYSLHQQCCDRLSLTIPDIESFLSWQRESSGCETLFLLLQYAHGLDLSPAVMQDPIIHQLTMLANDLISWSSDVYAYNNDQHSGNLHNVISILMYSNDMDVQSSVDYVASLYTSTMAIFLDLIQEIPSFGPKMDVQTATYVQSLQDCIVGTLHWSFETDRYFGADGRRTRDLGVVFLLPAMFG